MTSCSLVISILVTLFLVIQIDNVFTTRLEEANDPIQPIYLSKQDRLAPGNNNKNIISTKQQNVNELHSSASSFPSQKLNSNKEFVFGDEEEDDDEKQQPLVAVASSDTSNMMNEPAAIENEMKNKDETDDENDDDDDDDIQQQQQQHDEEKSDLKYGSVYEPEVYDDDENVVDDLDENSSVGSQEIINELKRSQRIDTHPQPEQKQFPGFLKFNKMADLQRKLLELSENKNNFDYDILINDELLGKNKLNKLNKMLPHKVGNSKKVNENSISGLGGGLVSQKEQVVEEEDDDETDDNKENEKNSVESEEIQHNKDDTITVEELLSQLENKLKTTEKAKFIRPTLEIKEQIYLEGSSTGNNKNLNKFNSKEQNSFFDPNNEAAMNDAFKMAGAKEADVNDDDDDDDNQEKINNDLITAVDSNQTSGHMSAKPSLKLKSDYTHSGFVSKFESIKRQNDYLFLFVVAGCTLAGVLALLAASVCWYTVTKSSKTSKSQTEFETSKNSMFGMQNTAHSSGSVKSNSSGDKKLALSAQMYHYQHQKEQMIAMEKANNDTKPDNSDNSDDETPEGDYTVYECPGLAPTGEMEVKNPLFKEDFSNSTTSLNKIQPPPSYSTLTLTTTSVVNETVQQTTGPTTVPAANVEFSQKEEK